MIKIKNENILNCTEDIIVHQVNAQGVMGGGLARQLADRYPSLENEYRKYCERYGNKYIELSGTVFWYNINKGEFIANMFSQKENFDTDYLAMKKALTKIKKYAEKVNFSIAIPYGIGCGIANGDWNEIYKIIEKVFDDYNVTLYKL